MNSYFLREKNKSANTPIVLVMLEVSKVYFAEIQSGSTKTALKIPTALDDKFTEDAFDPDLTGTGWATFISFESGNNKGTIRKVTSYSSETFHFAEALDNTPVAKDKIRISRNLCLASWDSVVSFYIPDNSNYDSIPLNFIPFPMKVEMVGTNTTGELLTISASVDNVNHVIGDAVQSAKGLRGNRLIYILTFNEILAEGKEGCIVNTMFIDSVTITPKDVVFALESRLNVININLPFCNYNRDFCRWVYKSVECKFSGTTDSSLDTATYLMASLASCDHTLSGPNGCRAHKNTRRFGGFPALVGK